MAKVDVASLFDLETRGLVWSSRNQGSIAQVWELFHYRLGSVIVFELDDATEVAIAKTPKGWEVVTHRLGEPSVIDQLRQKKASSPNGEPAHPTGGF